jgi:hypothetical protein
MGKSQEMFDLEYYKFNFIAPVIEDFKENPTSIRHAFIACVTTSHGVDYLTWPERPSKMRQMFRRQCKAFEIVDEVCHAFKHVGTSRRPGQGTQMLDVIFDEINYEGLSSDTSGKITLTNDRGLNLLETVNEALAYMMDEGIKYEQERKARGL